MKTSIQLCISRLLKVVSLKNNRLEGPSVNYYNFYVDNLFKDYNLSLTTKDREEEVIPGSQASDGTFSYTGCLASIQSNQSDYILQFVSHPMIGKNLSMGGIYGDSSPIIISAYNPQVNLIPSTILANFSSPVPMDMQLLFVLSLFILFSILYAFFSCKLFYRRKKKRSSPCQISFDIIIGSLLRNYSCFESKIDSRKSIHSIRPLIFLVVIFTFLFMTFVCSLIKTDQVVVPEQKQ